MRRGVALHFMHERTKKYFAVEIYFTSLTATARFFYCKARN